MFSAKFLMGLCLRPGFERRLFQKISDPSVCVQQCVNLASEFFITCTGFIQKCDTLVNREPESLRENDHVAAGIVTHTSTVSNAGPLKGGPQFE